jgi:hypothetical protein
MDSYSVDILGYLPHGALVLGSSLALKFGRLRVNPSNHCLMLLPQKNIRGILFLDNNVPQPGSSPK